MTENNKEQEKEEIYDIGGYYKKGGIWYKKVYGPGPDIPMMMIGPGPNPDPRPIGPKYDEHGRPTNQPLLNESPRPSIAELVAQLEEQLKKKKNGKNP